ncbi:MAG: LamG domain-containing protein [Verrucomicrobiota bacterium]|nr:LamG domain-containing protein [Verrucomicrobiota bacterium]
MKPISHLITAFVLPFALLTAASSTASAATTNQFSWQSPHATVLATGDLEWAPEPFVYEAGASVYYIDYEGGNNLNDGRTPQTAFKHHPWDANAPAAVRAITGTHTYVFKRGVIYRGTLVANASGTAGNPIRLTSDPSWGVGEAAIYGSERITSGWTQCGAADVVNINDYAKVWYKDLPFTIQDNSYGGTAGQVFSSVVCEVLDGQINRINLARAPNWEITDISNPQKNWWSVASSGGPRIQETFPQTNAADWIGGTIWSTWGTGSGLDANMATGQQGKITGYTAGAITVDIRSDPGCKYFVENLPQLLDSPNEFYYQPTGTFTRRLFVRLSGDRNPNTAVIEVGARNNIIRIVDRNHIVISGLTLACNNQPRPGIVPNPGHWNTNDGNNQAIEISGTCNTIAVKNCKFRHIIMAIAPRRDDGVAANAFDNFTITDNDIAFNEDQAITIATKGSPGFVRNCKLLRNKLSQIGYRQTCRSYSSIPSIQVGNATSSEIAGNFVESCYGSGINVYTVTGNTAQPGSQVRTLVHHNKVVHSLLGLNDYGGIEGWGDGPTFFYNNISGDARGYRPFSGNNQYNPWGHAIYFDHAHHHFAFNNIVWGLNNAINDSSARNNSGFMQAVADSNFYANNTIYRLYRAFNSASTGSKYVGNLMQNITFTFHEDENSLSWIAYAKNAYNGTPSRFNSTSANLAGFKSFLSGGKALSSQVGLQSTASLMIDPENFDFRPTGEAIGNGARIFVPWNLAQVKGEWHFYAHPQDYTTIASNNAPTGGTGNTLRCMSATAASFVTCALEDWTNGALRFNGTSTYATATDNAALNMTTNSFIVETYLRTTQGDRVIVAKGTATGYKLELAPDGKVRMTLTASGSTYWQESLAVVTDDNWHHLLAEVDRGNNRINLYVDGTASTGATSGTMPASSVSLTNAEDFQVGRESSGRYFTGDIDFLRVSARSFTDALTSFEELYAWQFNGPALRDFTGNKVNGPRNVGAIHFQNDAGIDPFQVDQIMTSNGSISFSWPGVSGVTYTVLRSTNLADWTSVETFSGNNTPLSFSETLGSNEKVFYKVSAVTAE